MKSIFTYSQFRPFLKDFYLNQKNQNPSYTYAKFSIEAGLNSPNYLKLVIDGKRNLTITNIHQFAKAVRLNFYELTYFEALVLKDQSDTDVEHRYYFQRVQEIKKAMPTKGAKLNFKEFVSQWYYPAIVVGVHGKSISESLQATADLIGISIAQLREGLEILMKKNIVITRDNKYYFDANHVTYHDPKLSNIHQRNYLKSQLDLSHRAFKKNYDKGAKFYSHTFTMPEADFTYYESKLNSFIESMIAKADQGTPEKITQLNLQFFSLKEIGS